MPIIGDKGNYKPQLLNYSGENKLSNENVLVERFLSKTKAKLIATVDNTLAGKIEFRFKPVEELPKKYQEIRNDALAFTQKEKN